MQMAKGNAFTYKYCIYDTHYIKKLKLLLSWHYDLNGHWLLDMLQGHALIRFNSQGEQRNSMLQKLYICTK